MTDWIGWLATGLFTSSYFFRSSRVLRFVQAAAACLWIAYGASVGAAPVVVANVIVALAAVFSTLREGAMRGRPEPETS